MLRVSYLFIVQRTLTKALKNRMDPAQKEAALKAAKEKADEATKALETAQAELKAAEEAKDEAKLTAAKQKVQSAQGAKDAADADVLELGDDAAGGADELLADGTPAKKKVQLPFDKFQDLNEKARLFEQFGPVLAKLRDNPKLLEKLMAGDDPTLTIEQRMAALEKREADAKRAEVKGVITRAIGTWGSDFKEAWDELKTMLPALEAQGIGYADAVQRAYFAVRPEAMAKGKKLVELDEARRRENDRGAGGPLGGGGPIIHSRDGGPRYAMTEADKDFALKTGIDPALYEKHADWIDRFADL